MREQLVFVGYCAVDLLLTDAAASSRATYDVDLVAQVTALSGCHKLEEEFVRLGFKRDVSKEAPICRWRLGNLDVDLIPTDTRILGFANRLVSIGDEIAASPVELQRYLAGRCGALLETQNFMDTMQSMVFPDESLAERVQLLVERFRQIAQSGAA